MANIGKVTVTNSPSLVVTTNVNRTRLLIENINSTSPVYIGGVAVTTANGFPIPAGLQLLDKNYLGTYYVIGSGEIRYIEEQK